MELAKRIYWQVHSFILRWLDPQARTPATIARQFHSLYYKSGDTTWDNTFWMGAKVLKCPLDLWVYQEIIFDTKPDVIVETGTRHGGSALYLASLCDLLGHGRVISIDIEPAKGRPAHPRITYLLGSSTSVQMIRDVETAVLGNAVMVSLDSDHSKAHVLEEMRLYSRFVSKGHYMIVEDTNVNGHPVLPEFGPGPLEAVEEFLVDHDEFEVDEAREKFLLTFHSRGFLK